MTLSLTFWSAACLFFLLVSNVQGDSISTAGEPLREPDKLYVNYEGANTTLYVRLCRWTVTDIDSSVIVNMTRYCYCTESSDDDPSSDSCTTPGPTLEMKSNTSINVTVVNELIGSSIVYGQNSSFFNQYKDMDTTNLHVHGLHVSPFIDDILVKIKPSQWHNYTYDMPFHYPGTFWYHAHHHGSTTWQVGMGLHGVILMRSDDDMTDKYEENVLQFTWQYIIPFSLCVNTTDSVANNNCPRNSDGTYSSRFVLSNEFFESYSDVFTEFSAEQQAANREINIIGNLADNSLCDIYCEMPNTQRSVSGYTYDVETDIDPTNFTQQVGGATYYPNLVKFFVNGQFEPVINDMKVGVFRRLRLINSLSNWYIQFLLPSTDCDWYLIATDGVFIGGEYMNYNLAQSTHNSQYLLGPGNRADIMLRCNKTGTYTVHATESLENDPGTYGLNEFQRIYNGTLLFSFTVNELNNTNININQTELPKKYPEKPIGSYIEDLSELNSSQYISECECNYADNILGIDNQCLFQFSILAPLYPAPIGANTTIYPSGHSVNLRQFEVDPDNTGSYPYEETSLTLLEKSQAYEFIINNDWDITYTNLVNQNLPPEKKQAALVLAHVYHQHINPFQVPNAIAGGFIALPKTWWDTMGNLPVGTASINNTADENGYITMRFWTRDYDGLVILHCHLLQHEDEGMMGYFNILPEGQKVFPNNCTNRVYNDDISTTMAMVDVVEPTDDDITGMDTTMITTKDSTDGGNIYMVNFRLFIVFIGVLVVSIVNHV